MPVTALRLVAYIMAPPWAKWLQRFLLVVSYSLVVMTGLRSLELQSGLLLTASGIVMIIGALTATVAAMLRLYNFESIGLYIACAGLFGGALWSSGEGAWYVAYVVLAVVCLLGLRLLTLNRIANALHAEHQLAVLAAGGG